LGQFECRRTRIDYEIRDSFSGWNRRAGRAFYRRDMGQPNGGRFLLRPNAEGAAGAVGGANAVSVLGGRSLRAHENVVGRVRTRTRDFSQISGRAIGGGAFVPFIRHSALDPRERLDALSRRASLCLA